MAAYISGGLNNYNIHGHTYYGTGVDGLISMTDYVAYCYQAEGNNIFIGFYDAQHCLSVIYLDGESFNNFYTINPLASGATNVATSVKGQSARERHSKVIDLGRNNMATATYEHIPYAVGGRVQKISGLTVNNEVNGATDNALAGAGIWGVITSNAEWNENGIELKDVCRYPKEIPVQNELGSVYSTISPTVENPIEIEIIFGNRPITSFDSLWIQFDHRYVAEDFTIHWSNRVNGEYNSSFQVEGNNNVVFYYNAHQISAKNIYRVKIVITKALIIENFKYQNAAYQEEIITYNPDKLIGIVNIGMANKEPFGRAFLGECGGSLYGDVDVHGNRLRNLGYPSEEGDVVNKKYLDDAVGDIETSLDSIITEYGLDIDTINLLDEIIDSQNEFLEVDE
jgi:hypothetical protein